MKKTYKYAVVGLLFLFLAGCEDFLDKREDSGGLTEGTGGLNMNFTNLFKGCI